MLNIYIHVYYDYRSCNWDQMLLIQFIFKYHLGTYMYDINMDVQVHLNMYEYALIMLIFYH